MSENSSPRTNVTADDNAEALGRFVRAAVDAADTFEKYAEILRCAEVRHLIAEAVIEMEAQQHG